MEASSTTTSDVGDEPQGQPEMLSQFCPCAQRDTAEPDCAGLRAVFVVETFPARIDVRSPTDARTRTTRIECECADIDRCLHGCRSPNEPFAGHLSRWNSRQSFAEDTFVAGTTKASPVRGSSVELGRYHSSELSGSFASTLDGTVIDSGGDHALPPIAMRPGKSWGATSRRDFASSASAALEAQMHAFDRSGCDSSCRSNLAPTLSHCTSSCSAAGAWKRRSSGSMRMCRRLGS